MPKSGWYMKRHIRAATIGATRIGVVSTVRTMAMPGRWRSRKIHAASTKPSTISAVSAVRVKTKLRKKRDLERRGPEQIAVVVETDEARGQRLKEILPVEGRVDHIDDRHDHEGEQKADDRVQHQGRGEALAP